ncbi:hypothetical protein PINS_up007699 [Pythium insidiosum]|nr:hypothetical protein PINS_up007699 [Pythium insidiosum]
MVCKGPRKADVAVGGAQLNGTTLSVTYATDNFFSSSQSVPRYERQAMYTSAFYYLMAEAAVTAINDTQLAVNNSMNASSKPLALSKSDMLGNVKLKGDLQIRKIRVLIPKSSFLTTLGGLVVVVLLTIVVLAFPRRRVRGVFGEETTDAQKFIVLSNDEEYPNVVHRKTLYFPSSSEQVEFDDLVVERMALLHEETRDQRIYM